MQVKVYTIPLFENSELTEEMNSFLRVHKVLSVDNKLVTVGEQAFWTFCITYLPQQNHCTPEPVQQKKNRTDYKYLLDDETFAKFSRLRLIRKQLAEQEAVPAYAVFTDSELADISRLEEITPENIRQIQGIGQKKVEKYGIAMCEKYCEQETEQ